MYSDLFLSVPSLICYPTRCLMLLLFQALLLVSIEEHDGNAPVIPFLLTKYKKLFIITFNHPPYIPITQPFLLQWPSMWPPLNRMWSCTIAYLSIHFPLFPPLLFFLDVSPFPRYCIQVPFCWYNHLSCVLWYGGRVEIWIGSIRISGVGRRGEREGEMGRRSRRRNGKRRGRGAQGKQ